jgi:hypothetical protein
MPAQGLYVDHQAYNLAVDRDGNSYVVGDTFGDYGNVHLVKFGPDGTQGWVAVLPESSYNFCNMALTTDTEQNIIFASNVIQGSSHGFMVAKFSPGGSRLWRTLYWHSASGPSPSPFTTVDVAVDLAGSIYVEGTGIPGQTEEDIAVCKFDSSGRFRWARYFDGQRHSYDWGSGLAVTASGVLYVCGYALDQARRINAAVVKYDTAGTQLWSYVYMPNSNYKSQANCVGAAPDGSVYVAGYRATITGGRNEFLLVKLTINGDTAWTRADTSMAYSLVVDQDSSVTVVGDYLNDVMRTWKYAPSGQLLWRDNYASDTVGTLGQFACLASDHSIYAVGMRYLIPPAPPDFRVLKYSSSGQVLWEGVYDSTDSYFDVLIAAVTGPDDAVYLAGTREHGGHEYSHYVLMKYRSSGAVEELTGAATARGPRISVSPSVVSSRCVLTIPASTRSPVLEVTDITGRCVRQFAVPSRNAGGNSSVVWDASDDSHRPVPNGVYFVRLASGVTRDASSVAKLIVQRN